jgi:L-ascorbate metabolism protein UlaG (beta-lactamase superfamily)
MPTLTYHGHACFEVSTEDHAVIIDPWLTDNPQADVGPEQIECRGILVTHGHSDHLGNALAIALRTNAEVVTTYELAQYFIDGGAQRVHAMHIGGGHQFRFGHVKLTPALHGGAVHGDETGRYTCTPCGFLLDMDGKVVYHAGDTALSAEMGLIGRRNKIACALLPVGDNYTMGLDDAVEAVLMLKPKVVIPMHVNTYEFIQQDLSSFPARVRAKTKGKTKAVLLEPGETYVVK